MDKLKEVKKIIQMMNEGSVTTQDLQTFITATLEFVKKQKDDFLQISQDSIDEIDKIVLYIEKEHEKTLQKVDEKSSKLEQELTKQIKEVKYLLEGAKNLIPQDGRDGLNGKDGKDGSPDTPEEIVKKINTTENSIDAKVIKDSATYVRKNDLDYAVSVLENQTRFLIASNSNRGSTTGGGGGAVDSVNGETGVVVLTTGDIAEDTDFNYVSDAQLTVIGNTSGTNTGDQDLSSYLTSATAASTYQPLDTQLTSVAGLSYTGNSLKVIRVNAGETDFELATVGGSGTVTSVALSVPTGLTISGSPITTTGTLAVALDTGYVIPLQTTLDGFVTEDQTVGQTIGDTTNRLVKLWATDITVTNAIAGSITGNAGTVTNGLYTTDVGSVVQAYDADLTTWAGITPGTGVGTALAVNVGSAGAFITYNGNAGTPSALVGTNITGTASGLTAGAVTGFTAGAGTLTGPASSGVAVTLGNAETITGVKTMSGLNSVLVSSSGLTIRNPANTFKYTLTAGAIAADRQLDLPLITGTDTLAVLGLDQTFTGVQTFTSPATTTSITTGSTSFTAWAGATTLLTIGGTGASASLFAPSTLDTSSSTTGAIRTSGGISAAKAMWVGTKLTVASSIDLLAGSINLAENTSIALDPAGSADGKWTGITVTGVSDYSQAFGDLVYLKSSNSRWAAADADADTTADRMLAMVVVTGTSGNACTLLLQGIIRADAKFPTMTIGSAMYVGETAGAIQVAIPTGADNVIRRVGYAMTADELYFNPSMDSQTTVA